MLNLKLRLGIQRILQETVVKLKKKISTKLKFIASTVLADQSYANVI